MKTLKTPIAVQSKRFLVDANKDLICATESATPAELAAIVHAVNAYPVMRTALRLARFALDRNIGDAPTPDDIAAYDAVVSAEQLL